MADEPMGDLVGRELGEFILREQIARGGYSVVYRSEQPALHRDVVVKVQLAQRRLNDATRERFLLEAQLASRLDHPYAAHVYASGATDDGLLWLAMELVQGPTLGEWLETHGPMPLDQFVPLFERIADVVQTAHARGIVHRDLKPSNMMVIERSGRLFPKLLDFGIAKVGDGVAPLPLGSLFPPPGDDAVPPREQSSPQDAQRTRTGPANFRLTRSGSIMGSAAYMAPEQWKNAHAVGPAADIYSLGIVAYEALTGRRPFDAATTHQYYALHQEADVPLVGGDLPPGLDRVIHRALAKDPSARHHDVMELAAELRAVLRVQPREQLRSSAQQWKDRAGAPGFLWGGDALADLERWTREAPPGALSELECSFVAASQRRARRIRWARRSLVMVAAVAVLGVLQLRSMMRARMDEQHATESEVEQGRQALLHGESSDAVQHLERAYQRGDHSSAVEFMLARALQPRVAELGRFASNSGRMWSATFAPDNKRILTTDDKAARMWDAASGQLLFTMSHGDSVYRAVFSRDGSSIVTAGGDGTVGMWSAANGASIRKLKGPEPDAIQWRYDKVGIAGPFVVAIDTKGRAARVWDASTGILVAELENDASEASSLAVSADSRWLATSGGDDVRVFDTSTWRRVATIAGPRVRSLCFDPSGLRLVVGTHDGITSIWDIPTGERLRRLREAGAPVDAVAFSTDGALVAAGSRDGTVQVWDAVSGGLRMEFNAHHDKVFAIEFAASGNLMLSAGGDGAVVVANVASGMTVARLEGPTELVRSAHFDQSAQRVVGASWDGTARVWDATSPYHAWGSPPIGPECDTAESLVPDQRFVALSCRNHGTRVWDTARNQLLAELPSSTSAGAGYDPAFPAVTGTGDRAAIARGNTVEVYALPSGQLLRTVVHPATVSAVAFAPTGHDLVSGAVDGSLQLTHDDRDPIALPRSPAGIDGALILAGGQVVASDAGNRLRVIDPERRTVLADLQAPARARLLRSSPDGTRLVTIALRGTPVPPTLWDLAEHRLVATLEGHAGRVFTARFVSSGREILTAGQDGTARLWDAATGRSRRTLRGSSQFLADAALAPDGSLVVAGGSDGLLRFWDTSSGHLLWTLPAHKSYVVGVHYEGNDIVSRGFAGDVSRWTLPPAGKILEMCHASACAPPTSAGE